MGVLLVREDGRLLVGYRVRPDEPATWCLPGGHLEPGETLETAGLRELAEETGITAVDRAEVFALVLDDHRGAVRLTAGVLAHVVEAEPVVREPEIFARWSWVDPGAVPEPLFPATAALLDAWRGAPPAPGHTVYPLAAPPRRSPPPTG